MPAPWPRRYRVYMPSWSVLTLALIKYCCTSMHLERDLRSWVQRAGRLGPKGESVHALVIGHEEGGQREHGVPVLLVGAAHLI